MPTFDAGAKAAVTGWGNVYPDAIRKFSGAYSIGSREHLMQFQKEVFTVRQITKDGPAVPTCQAILKLCGIDSGFPRLTYTRIPAETEELVKKAP